ncbi:MAG: flagellar export protein FliJ [Deltaproteobacteria bacterium]|jgi:flagellar export protein FliJ|nr:flagellar export protein FliJ [Deltaproteobacteria bacterium]
MAAFKFRLDFLITLRRRREEEAAVRLTRRLASIRELEDKIEARESDRARLSEEISERGRLGTVTPALLSLYSGYQAKLLQDLKKADELLTLSRRELAKEQAALRKAVIERQIMERIREKQAEAFQAEEFRKEQNVLEEMHALVKARRDRMEREDDAS